MAGSDIRIGPWPEGINLLDKPDQIRDSQLANAVNFDFDNTGVLVPRRPLRYLAQDAATMTKYLVGTVMLDGDTQPKAVTASYDGTSTYFRAVGDPTAAIQNFGTSPGGRYNSIVQYQNKLWYIPATASTAGAHSPASLTNTITSVAAMPYGDYGFILKDRLFVVRKTTSEIYFSKATDFTVWAAPDGGVIQINPGDNNPITKVVVVNNQVVIFKRDSTYVLSFSANPTGDGVVRQVSADQGALDAITYNNEVYCYNARSVFKFVNGFFQDIGLQLALPVNDTIDTTATSPAKINVVGKTLIFGSTPSGKSYAMNLDTGAWTTYDYTSTDLSISTGTVFSRSAVGTTVFFGDGTTKLGYIITARANNRLTDQKSDGTYSSILYKMRTKEFDFDDSEAWKRMYSWHFDVQFLNSPNNASPYGTAYTYINGVQNNSTTDVVDLVGSSLSYRFKRTSMGYEAPRFADNATNALGMEIRGLRAVIAAKAPVSK